MPDADEIPSYDNIEKAMVSGMAKLERCTADYARATDAYAVAEADYRYAYAVARMNMREQCKVVGEKYTDKVGEDAAVIETAELYLAAEKARAVQDAARQGMLSTRSRLEALRSLMASHREITR